ncbi:unnamed protein product [Scytosiphon promiscuus]
MFPRGAGNLEEVPQYLVFRCMRSDDLLPGLSQPAGVSAIFETVAQAGIGWGYLSPKEWCRTMLTCKLAKQAFQCKHEWLEALGYKLIKQPDGFSAAALLSFLLQDAAFSGEAWRTALLTGKVREQARADAPQNFLVALATPEDSQKFWADRLKGMLGLSNFPTGPQVEETKTTVGLLVDRATGAGLSALMEACLSVDKPNGTIGPLILAEVIEMAPRKLPSAITVADTLPAASSPSAVPPPRTYASIAAAGQPPAPPAKNETVKKCERTMVTEEESGDKEFLDHDAISSLLANCGVTSVRTLVMLMGGVPVESLKADVSTLSKLKGVSIPRSVRRAMVNALAKSSWFALLSVFRFSTFFKNLFKCIHVVEVLKDKDGNIKTDPAKAKVFLLQALLRGQPYPRDQAAFDALADAGKPWDKLIAAPLARIGEDPLFRVADEWTVPVFQETLAGKKIPLPQCTSVESMLCAHGNRRITWHAIFECGEITSKQILRNLVSLIMMDFPVEVVKTQLLKSIDRAPMTDLLKVYTVLKTTFTPAEIESLRDEALEKALGALGRVQSGNAALATGEGSRSPFMLAAPQARRRKKKSKGNPRLSSQVGHAGRAPGATRPHVHPEPPPMKKKKKEEKIDEGSSELAATVVASEGKAELGGESNSPGKARDPSTDEVRVMRECGVADKKGQRHQITRPRTISTRFGQESVDGYRCLVTSALSRKMEDLTSVASAKMDVSVTDGGDSEAVARGRNDAEREVVGVISYTEELSRNVIRSGVPPPLPKYTKVAMWRGEDVCLNQLGAGDMKELLVGITWCEPKGSTTRIDLDLSVMVYDSEWRHLADCSYDTPDMSIAGVQHSGDVLKAPYPHGARETCTINFAGLRKGFPKARYIVLAVYSFSRQKWDDLEDASVFVANPHARGSGPGGIAVIGAARLTGDATTSIAGYLDLAPAGIPDENAPPAKEVFGIGGNAPKMTDKTVPAAGEESEVRVHFVFTDQEGRIGQGGFHARGSTCAVGQMLSMMEESRKQAGKQSLSDAAAFQAALVCDRVRIVGDKGARRGGEENPAPPALRTLVRRDDEGRFDFYERVANALEEATPAAPAAAKKGGAGGADAGSTYPAEALASARPTAVTDDGTGDRTTKFGHWDKYHPAQHTLFFGGDLDDWLEVTRQHGIIAKAAGAAGGGANTLTLVNMRSPEKGWAKSDEAGISKVNGATSYEELAQAVLEARGRPIEYRRSVD